MTRRTGLYLVSIAVALSVALSGCGGPQKLANMSSGELYTMAKDKYDHKKYYRAIELFQNLVYAHAGDPIVDTAQYYLGMSYFGNGEYQLATAEFNRLLINYPSSAFAEHAQFMRAASTFQSAPKHFGLDQTELKPAIEQLQDFITDRPESPYLADAKGLLLSGRTRIAHKLYQSAIVYFRVDSYVAANIYLQKVVDDYLDTEFAPKSLYMIAEGEFRMKHYDVAREKFDGFTKVFPKHEWVQKASRRAADASFRGSVAAFDAGDMSKAAEQFQSFKSGFPNDDRVKEADSYLAKTKEKNAEPTKSGDTKS